MSNTLLIIGGLALVGVAIYSYRRRNAKKSASKEELINSLVSSLSAEKLEKLALSDVVYYFKSLRLKNGVDIPFIAKTSKNGVTSYLLAVYREDSNEIANGKLISTNTIDEELQKVIGSETFVVLS